MARVIWELSLLNLKTSRNNGYSLSTKCIISRCATKREILNTDLLGGTCFLKFAGNFINLAVSPDKPAGQRLNPNIFPDASRNVQVNILCHCRKNMDSQSQLLVLRRHAAL